MKRRNILAGLAALPFLRWLPKATAYIAGDAAAERLFTGEIGLYYAVRFITYGPAPECAAHSREEDFDRMEVIHFQYADWDPWAESDEDEEVA